MDRIEPIPATPARFIQPDMKPWFEKRREFLHRDTRYGLNGLAADTIEQLAIHIAIRTERISNSRNYAAIKAEWIETSNYWRQIFGLPTQNKVLSMAEIPDFKRLASKFEAELAIRELHGK